LRSITNSECVPIQSGLTNQQKSRAEKTGRLPVYHTRKSRGMHHPSLGGRPESSAFGPSPAQSGALPGMDDADPGYGREISNVERQEMGHFVCLHYRDQSRVVNPLPTEVMRADQCQPMVEDGWDVFEQGKLIEQPIDFQTGPGGIPTQSIGDGGACCDRPEFNQNLRSQKTGLVPCQELRNGSPRRIMALRAWIGEPQQNVSVQQVGGHQSYIVSRWSASSGSPGPSR